MGNYWDTSGKCGLEGGAGEWVEDAVHGMVLVPDQDNPAVLPDETILYGMTQSRIARSHFKKLYPSLSPEAKARLQTLLGPNLTVDLVEDPLHYSDIVQQNAIKNIPVRTSGRHGGGN